MRVDSQLPRPYDMGMLELFSLPLGCYIRHPLDYKGETQLSMGVPSAHVGPFLACSQLPPLPPPTSFHLCANTYPILAAHSFWGIYFPWETTDTGMAHSPSSQQELLIPAQAWASILDSSPLTMASWVSVQPPTSSCKGGCPHQSAGTMGHLTGYKLASPSILLL